MTPNRLIGNLYSPAEGKRHDIGMLLQSSLLRQLQQFAQTPNEEPVCFYGDTAYSLRSHLQAPFRGNRTPQQEAFNIAMSNIRVAVEWLLNEIATYFSFLEKWTLHSWKNVYCMRYNDKCYNLLIQISDI